MGQLALQVFSKGCIQKAGRMVCLPSGPVNCAVTSIWEGSNAFLKFTSTANCVSNRPYCGTTTGSAVAVGEIVPVAGSVGLGLGLGTSVSETLCAAIAGEPPRRFPITAVNTVSRAIRMVING